MQSLLLGYLLTSDNQYLADFGDARAALGKNITTLAALVADNPSQEQQVREIYDLQETWTKTLESLLNQSAGGHFGKEAFAESRQTPGRYSTRSKSSSPLSNDFAAKELQAKRFENARCLCGCLCLPPP